MRVSRAGTLLAVAALSFIWSVPRAHAGSATFEYNGITYVSFQDKEYLSAGSEQSLNDLAATGANAAGLLVTWYVDSSQGNVISRRPLKTPDDEAVVKAIRDMRARGLKIMLKPHVDVIDDSWRGLLNPSDPDAWFASYTAFITHYARLAQEHGVELFCMGTEFRSMSGLQNRARWAAVIAAIRAEYSGPLTYSSLAIFVGDEYATVSFWDLLDVAGVNVYAPLTNGTKPTVDELVAAWTKNKINQDMVAEIRNFQARLNKPVILTEMGYQSADGTNTNPTQNNFSLPYDPQEQADCYEAVFRVWTQEAWLSGIFWWGWAVQAPGESDTSFTARAKPAADVLKTWYGKPAPPFYFTSTPVALPDPAIVATSVSFFATAVRGDETVPIAWDFGDGTQDAGASPSHVYVAEGTYTVRATATASDGAVLSSTFALRVIAPVSPTDADGDGFPNEVELAAGTSPTDAASTPFGGNPPGAAQALTVNRLRINLNMRAGRKDRIALTGKVPLAGIAGDGERVIIDMGRYVRVFDSARVVEKDVAWRMRVREGREGRFSLRLTPMEIGSIDFVGSAQPNSTSAQQIVVTVYFRQAVFTATVTGKYRDLLERDQFLQTR